MSYKLEREKWKDNGVIVTVYEEEESRTVGSQIDYHHHEDRRNDNRITRRGMMNSSEPFNYYDRRADLLAYVRHLQDNMGSDKHLHQDRSLTTSKPNPKNKRRFSFPLRKLRLSFGQIFGGKNKKYQRIKSGVKEGKYYMSCNPRRSKLGQMSKILRRLLKELAASSKCDKQI